jgi:diacylglycerol O-acyltransferase
MTDVSPWSRDVSALDYLMYRADTDSRTRTTMMSIELLETAPDWDRLRADIDRASRVVPRLRQRVVAPILPLGPAHWVYDPDFELDYHLRRVRVAQPGGRRELLELAQTVHNAPLDLSRPLWEATLVEGLDSDGATAALLWKLSHAITDGVGGVEMDRCIRAYQPHASAEPAPIPPAVGDTTAAQLTGHHLVRLPLNLVRAAGRGAELIGGAASRLARQPISALQDAGRLVTSLQQMAGPPPAPGSPLLSRRSLNRRITIAEIPLPGLKAAAKRHGRSLNDAYLAALSGGLRHYHAAMNCPVASLPLTLPVSIRADSSAGGNRWGALRIAAPIDEADPVRRMSMIGAQVQAGRSQPAIGALSVLSPFLTALPMSVVSALMTAGASCDVQASNVRGHQRDTYIGGSRVLAMYPIGPLPAAAIMSVLLSHAGRLYLGINYDTAAVTDGGLLDRSLQLGFAEVIKSSQVRLPTRRPRELAARARPAGPAQCDGSPAGRLTN